MKNTINKQLDNLLERRVEKILPSKEGLAQLLQKKKIRLYFGVDPTATRLHLGHTVGLRKLMDFANAGHEAILLFGTGTVLVGDPSLRAEARKKITQEEIEKNISGWKEQVKALVNFEKVKIKQNGDWLLKLNYQQIVNIASNITAVQLFKRESFQRRINQGNTVWYHETMYPLFQGYDSVAMDVDLEIGGTDQEFNMLVGRELQRKMNNREKFVLMTPMILGTDGKPMSKTTGNCVWLNDTPEDMFGKLMSILDEQIISYMKLVTDIPLDRISNLKQQLVSNQLNPMVAKKELAFAVVKQFHGDTAAQKAQEEFEKVHQGGGLPNKIPTFPLQKLTQNPIIVVDLLTETGLVVSRSEAKRLIEQGGVEIDGKRIKDLKLEISVRPKMIIKAGKRKFLKII